MYEGFFGLRERPFDLTPNPRFLFLTDRHREALSNLEYGIYGRKGITVLIGEAGTGKTTLIRAALAHQQQGTCCVSLNNPTLSRAEFVEYLAEAFGLSEKAGRSKARFLSELEHVLHERRAAGGVTALVVDEAQCLGEELLEEIRLLANIETETEKLLPVVLAGQPELAERLNQPSVRQLKQRVALRCELTSLTLQETAAYIVGRINIAGGDGTPLFTREAVTLIHERSRGIPRTISVLCDNTMVGAFAAGQRPVGRHIVQEVCRDFDLHEAAGGQPAKVQAARAEAPQAEPGQADVAQAAPARNAPGPQPATERQVAAVSAVLAGGNATNEIPVAASESRGLFSPLRQKKRFSFF